MRIKWNAVAWSIALPVLIAALWFYNAPALEQSAPPQESASSSSVSPDPDRAAEAAGDFSSSAPPGHEVGQQVPDFTLPLTDGGSFTLSECRGKVTVLNVWATWCVPCVNELPHFDLLQQTYPDTVRVLAIHSNFITSDPAAWLAGTDFSIPFAIDSSGEVVTSLGVSTMLPHTVILNARGEVTYNKTGSLTYEALEELVQDALQSL